MQNYDYGMVYLLRKSCFLCALSRDRPIYQADVWVLPILLASVGVDKMQTTCT